MKIIMLFLYGAVSFWAPFYVGYEVLPEWNEQWWSMPMFVTLLIWWLTSVLVLVSLTAEIVDKAHQPGKEE